MDPVTELFLARIGVDGSSIRAKALPEVLPFTQKWRPREEEPGRPENVGKPLFYPPDNGGHCITPLGHPQTIAT